jgi:hypothetical protein
MGSFWWKDVLRLNILFRGIAKCELGDGSLVCLSHYYTTDLSSIAQNAFSLGDFGDRD